MKRCSSGQRSFQKHLCTLCVYKVTVAGVISVAGIMGIFSRSTRMAFSSIHALTKAQHYHSVLTIRYWKTCCIN